jgi:hypothetical protein
MTNYASKYSSIEQYHLPATSINMGIISKPFDTAVAFFVQSLSTSRTYLAPEGSFVPH